MAHVHNLGPGEGISGSGGWILVERSPAGGYFVRFYMGDDTTFNVSEPLTNLSDAIGIAQRLAALQNMDTIYTRGVDA
jgi:hypothetical protein